MRWSSCIFAFCIVLAGCGGDKAGEDMGSGDQSMSGPDLTSTLCVDPRADAWALPLTKTSANGLFKLTLGGGDPDPPSIGINTWNIELADASDQPMSGASVTIKPWMPDHGHGTSVTPLPTAGTVAGSYSITPLFLFMAGLWQVTFTVQAAGSATSDTVVFSYCLADLQGS